jgi:hypothetical protein
MQNVPGMKHGGEITVGLERVVHLKAQDVKVANAFHYVHFAIGQSKIFSGTGLNKKSILLPVLVLRLYILK